VPSIFSDLLTAKRAVTLTPQEHERRIATIQAIVSKFVSATSPTAEAIAHAYHNAVQEQTARGPAAAEACLCAAVSSMRPDRTLSVAAGGIAGGIKVVDSRDEAFFKISEDQRGIYEGSSVMADKPAKHELSALALLHEALSGVHLTIPLVSCVDVTVRDGPSSRVYRVQAFSKLPISGDTLRSGSADAKLTVHVCAAMVAPIRDVAELFHLRLGKVVLRGASGKVRIHSYDRTADSRRDAAQVPEVGPEVERLLEDLGVGRAASLSSGICDLTEKESGAVIDPFRPVASAYSSTDIGADRLKSLPGMSDPGDPLSSVLPFDVEGHMLPSGERCIADTHRLCIPEVHGRSSCDDGPVIVIVRESGAIIVAEAPARSDDAAALARCALEALAAASEPSLPAADAASLQVLPGTGSAVLSWDGFPQIVLVSHPERYWKAVRLTELFPPSAGAVLRELGGDPMAPDDVMDPLLITALQPATELLLGTSGNVAEAGRAIVSRLVETLGGLGSDDVTSLRLAVKLGLHDRGLGLRHVWRAWPAAEASAAADGRASGVPPALLQSALVCACLPRPGSSAALALEELTIKAGHARPDGSTTKQRMGVVLACAAARAAAARGHHLPSGSRAALARRIAGSFTAKLVMRSWLLDQRHTSVSVKASGTGGKREASGARSGSGSAFQEEASRTRTALLSELAHRQSAGTGGEAAVLGQLAALGKRSAVTADEALLFALRRNDWSAAGLRSLGLLLSRQGRADAALEMLEASMRELPKADPSRSAQGQAELLTDMAGILGWRSRLDEAAALLERAVTLTWDDQAPDNQQACASLHSLGCLMLRKGQFAEALKNFERVLPVQGALYGQYSDTIGTTLHNIGIALTKLGRTQQAKSALSRSLLVRERSLGPDHALIAATLVAMGSVSVRVDDMDNAMECFERAKKIEEETLGPDHPDFASTLHNIASVLARQGRLKEARPLLEAAAAIHERLPGEPGLHMATILTTLGNTDVSEGNLKQGRTRLERGASIQERLLGRDAAPTLMARHNLATVIAKLGDPHRAFEELQAVCLVQERGSAEFIVTTCSIGNVCLDLGNYDLAIQFYSDALNLLGQRNGPSHHSCAKPMQGLAYAFAQKGDVVRARMLAEALGALDPP